MAPFLMRPVIGAAAPPPPPMGVIFHDQHAMRLPRDAFAVIGISPPVFLLIFDALDMRIRMPRPPCRRSASLSRAAGYAAPAARAICCHVESRPGRGARSHVGRARRCWHYCADGPARDFSIFSLLVSQRDTGAPIDKKVITEHLFMFTCCEVAVISVVLASLFCRAMIRALTIVCCFMIIKA